MQLTATFLQLSAALLAASAVNAAPAKGHGKQRSVIQLISDGFGPASETFARSFVQVRDGLPWTATLPIDEHLVGTIRTRSTDSLVTDSAASATAYSCGIKSVNAYIGIDTEKKPCGTVLEGAKAKGFNTALVTTSRVTHATPASYSAHVDDRDAEDEIASQQLGNYLLGRQVDLLWGGGLRHFLPNTTKPGIRVDGRDLTQEASRAGWQVMYNRTQFEAVKNGEKGIEFPSLGLFTSSHMSYEIDRLQEKEPSLTEMAIAALDALESKGEPYFIMIEGARIDHAGHNNDPLGHVHDIIEYNNMFSAVIEWMDKHASSGKGDDEDAENSGPVLIATSDHECGGLSLAVELDGEAEAEYLWYPDVLLNGTHSTEFLAGAFSDYNSTDGTTRSSDELRTYMADEVISKGLGISDATAEEIDTALRIASEDELALTIYLGSLLNWRAHLGWATTGHSGTDVNLYYYEPSVGEKKKKKQSQKGESDVPTARSAAFSGNHENTWVGEWTASYLDLDLPSITRQLNNGSSYSWTAEHGSDLSQFTRELEHYHGSKAVMNAARVGRRAERGSQEVYGYSHRENDAIRRRSSVHGKSHAKAKRDHLDL